MRKRISIVTGLILVLITIGMAQDDCVERIYRYTTAPKVSTLYPCCSIHYYKKYDIYSYQVSILCDSLCGGIKNYKLFAIMTRGMEYPQFEVRLKNGDTLFLYPDMALPKRQEASYIEAYLTENIVDYFRKGLVKNIAIFHWDCLRKPPEVKCEVFLQNFVIKH